MPKVDSLEKLFEMELKDLYDAEKRLTRALPKMARAAKAQPLKEALEEHLNITKGQVGRLEQAFAAAGLKAGAKTCAGMKGLIEEGEEVIEQGSVTPYIDLALIGSARRVEHYEMAAYLSLCDLAQQVHGEDVTGLLRQNLEEEEEADRTLETLARDFLSEAAGEANDEMMDEDEENMADEEEEDEEEAEVVPPKPARQRR